MATQRSTQGISTRSPTPAQRWYERIRWAQEHLSWIPAIGSGIASVASAVMFVFVLDKDNIVQPLPLTVGAFFGIIAIVLTVLIDQWRRRSKDDLTAERVQLQLTMNDAVKPIVMSLSKMSSQPSTARKQTLEQIIGHIGAAVPILLPVKRLRVVVYKVVDLPRQKRRLVVVNFVGRHDQPKQFVDEDGGRGEEVFAWIVGGEPLFVADTHEAQLAGWDSARHEYRTFISVPLVVEDQLFGMLAIDAPTPGDLDEADQPIAEVLGALLSSAFAFSQKA